MFFDFLKSNRRFPQSCFSLMKIKENENCRQDNSHSVNSKEVFLFISHLQFPSTAISLKNSAHHKKSLRKNTSLSFELFSGFAGKSPKFFSLIQMFLVYTAGCGVIFHSNTTGATNSNSHHAQSIHYPDSSQCFVSNT